MTEENAVKAEKAMKAMYELQTFCIEQKSCASCDIWNNCNGCLRGAPADWGYEDDDL